MKIKVKFYMGMKEVFGRREMEIELKDGASVQGLLDFICDSQERRKKMFSNGAISPYVLMMINQRHIEHLGGLRAGLNDGDTVDLLTGIGGG